MEHSPATMRGSLPAAVPNAAAYTVTAPPRPIRPSPDDDLSNYNWMDVAGGIVLAGGAYPIVAGAIFTGIQIIAALWQALAGFQPATGVEKLAGMLFAVATFGIVFSMIAGACGMVWSGIVTMLTMPLVYLFVRSLRLRANIVWFGAIWGGLVGFLAVLPLALAVMDDVLRLSGPLWPLLGMLALGPGLTTILGQLGGAWGGRRAARRHASFTWAQTLSVAGGWEAAETRPSDNGESLVGGPPPRFQFGIRHLLWITVWLSLLLSAIRLVGVPFEYVLPLLFGWLVHQSATLYTGWLFASRYRPQRTASSPSRST